jgi:hypothetical protein
LQDDDPKKKLTDAEQLARCAADKLFELKVSARRALKEKIAKVQQEMNEKATEDQPAQKYEPNPDQLHNLILMPDYPASKEEAINLSRYGQSLNGLFELHQSSLDENDMESIVAPEQDQEFVQKSMTVLKGLHEARACSHKSAPVRNMAYMRVPFRNQPLETTKEDENGETVTERVEAEELYFKAVFVEQI